MPLKPTDKIQVDLSWGRERLRGEATVISVEPGGRGRAARIEIEVGGQRRVLNARQCAYAMALARRAEVVPDQRPTVTAPGLCSRRYQDAR
jgi:hypothetical protein